MITLKAFLVELATHPEKFQEFIAKPETALNELDMNEEDKNLIKSGDMAAIEARLIENDKQARIACND